MKHLGKILMLPSILLAASACSDDVPGIDNNNSSDEAQVYMTFKLDNVAATRSQTDEGDDAWGNSNDGVEIGKDKENAINTVFVFLVPKNGTHAIVSATETTTIGPSSDQYYTVSFNRENIKQYAEQEMKVMIYCNLPSQTTYSQDLVLDTNSWGDGNSGEFVMSNADTDFNIALPSETNLKLYNTPENPFNLGAINVKRAAARFDIKAGSTYNNEPNKYAIEGNDDIFIELTDVSLVNQSKAWFMQHRTSATGDGSNPVLCGNENRTNYVVDTDWTTKLAWTKGTSTNDLFNNLSTESITSWTALSSITADDNDNTWNEGAEPKGDYKIWRYANENTLPYQTGKDMQVHALSTGIAFRGEIKCSATSGNLYNAFSAGKDLFVFRNKLIGSVEMVKALAATDPALKVAYEHCVTEGTDASNNTTYTVATDKAKAAGFSIFNATEVSGVKKYYVHYFYWNRHNDNGNPTVMGPMEFAVVRNNVYKLCVTKINLFGSPDPKDPDDPDTPDEQDKVYFNVDVRVMPWVVRINNIEL